MITERHRLDVGGIPVEVVRKDIKNLHVGVYPPEGRVRVAAPLRLDDDAVRLAVVSRLAWIRRRQAEFERQDRQSKREPRVGVTVAEVRIRRMKTLWGSCNTEARRIWLNLELAKKPASCLEYILVHEMAHLIERHHNEPFREWMDTLMPSWRLRREELNRAPLAHEAWRY